MEYQTNLVSFFKFVFILLYLLQLKYRHLQICEVIQYQIIAGISFDIQRLLSYNHLKNEYFKSISTICSFWGKR